MEIHAKDLFVLLFDIAIVWVVVGLVIVFLLIFPKLETELATIISLIKMIPPKTLFSMKVASFFKKRNLLEKFGRL